MIRRRLLPLLVVTSLVACSTEEEATEAHDAAPAAEEAAAPAPAPAPEPAPQKAVRRFMEIKGKVQVDGKDATADMVIPEKAEITTGADGHAVFTLEPGSAIELRKSSKVTLGTSTRKQMSLKLVAGALWSFLAKGSSYEVTTENAVAGVRGTVFYVEARGPKDSYICACDGEVEMEAANKKSFSKVITAKMEHKAFRFLTKGKKQVVKKAPRQNHTDAEKDMMLGMMEKAK